MSATVALVAPKVPEGLGVSFARWARSRCWVPLVGDLSLHKGKICTAHPQHVRLLFAYGWGTCIDFANALGWQDLLCLQGIPKT